MSPREERQKEQLEQQTQQHNEQMTAHAQFMKECDEREQRDRNDPKLSWMFKTERELRNEPQGKDEAFHQWLALEGEIRPLLNKYPNEQAFLTKLGETLIKRASKSPEEEAAYRDKIREAFSQGGTNADSIGPQSSFATNHKTNWKDSFRLPK
jgi:predicted  nucleic acid-binding Zn-ribbon protein